jgi:hypothetical protein
MYETEKQARDAVGKLRGEGFPKDTIFLLANPAPKSDEETAEPLSMAIKAGFIPRQHLSVYNELLQQGRSLVAVRAPFGQARLATGILDSCGPVDTGIRPPERRSIAWEPGAPLSSALLLPPLSRHKPDAFSMSFGFPTLASGPTTRAKLADPHMAVFGQPSMSRNPAPLSSIFHIKTISGKSGASWRSSFGLRMLSDNPAPFSSWLGLHLLKDKPRPSEPAPFSAGLGIPTLSKGRSVLSRMFGELGSPHFALFGRNPLIDKAAPLSSAFGLKMLSGKSGSSWTSSFGLPMLTAGQGPALGVPWLSRSPAPFSSFFGLRVLSRYQ